LNCDGSRKASKTLFFEKKNQKSFALGSFGQANAPGEQTFFGYFFSKK